MGWPPERIVCLTGETVAALGLLGQAQRSTGVSLHALRPARVRRGKPRAGAFAPAGVAGNVGMIRAALFPDAARSIA